MSYHNKEVDRTIEKGEDKNMAHNLNEKDGKAAMMYVGAEPWHGLGTKLEGASTSAEAIAAAGLDWAVSKEPAFFKKPAKDGLTGFKAIPDAFAVVRGDTQDALGVVGKRYTPLQNRDAFSFFDAIVGMKEAIYHTAGALGQGERVWLLAKLPGYVRVVGDDVTEKFLLLTNTHDGTGSVKVLFTPIRVVCQNTLNGALEGADKAFKMRHTPGMGLKVEEAQKALGIVSAKFGIFEEAARKLAASELTIQAEKNYFERVALKGKTLGEGEEIPAKTQTIIEEMSRLFETGRGADMKGAKGTLWGAYNAVVEYADFYRGTNGNGTREIRMNRADASIFGTGAAMKERAWAAALEMAGAPSKLWA